MKFTEHRRKQLVERGWQNVDGNDVVRQGKGRYTKRFGAVYLTLVIRSGEFLRAEFALHFQGRELEFLRQCVKDTERAIDEVKALGPFEELNQ